MVGTDPKTDVAVVKINATGLPTLPIGDSSKMQVGDIVLAIGDPFGIGKTATMGIVSATGRGGLGIENYEDFIQTDASINPGNSGGALIDLHGSLIGINTAILSGEGGGNQGIGFAIPINMARNVMNQIVEHGKVVRGYLGVHIQDVTPESGSAVRIEPGRRRSDRRRFARYACGKGRPQEGRRGARIEWPANRSCQPTPGANLADGAWDFRQDEDLARRQVAGRHRDSRRIAGNSGKGRRWGRAPKARWKESRCRI